MKDGKTQAQILALLEWHKSTISRELARNMGLKGYRPKQACLLAEERSLGSRNAAHINPKDWDKTVACLHKKWSPEQITNHVGISHEMICRHVYADKAAGGSLYQKLRCQKKRKKRYASGRDRRGQIVGRRPINELPVHIEARSQIGHWEGDPVIGAAHQEAIVILVVHKSSSAMIAKVSNKTSELVIVAITNKLSPMAY
jgi:IS30 family transposase